MNTTQIYLVENCYGDINKVYIGKEKSHQRQGRKNSHQNTFGKDVIFTYIDEAEGWNKENWEPLETYWIEQFRQWGFEIMNKRKKGGSGSDFCTQETKDKIGKGNKGKIVSQETRIKMRKPRLTSKKGKDHGLYGIKKSKAAKEKMLLSAKNRKYPKDWGEKIKKGHINKNKDFYKSKEWLSHFNKSIYQYDLQDIFIKEWNSIKEASECLNINRIGITHCLIENQKTAYGFKWKYKN